MKRNPGYTLTYLADMPYLLPYGQLIANRKHGIQLNDTGVLIWNLLENPVELSDLVELVAREYDLPATERSPLWEDVKSFTSKLVLLGILSDEPELPTVPPKTIIPTSISPNPTPDAPHPKVEVQNPTAGISSREIPVPTPQICLADNNLSEDPAYCHLQIAGLTLKLCGPAEAFSKDFDLFKISDDSRSLASISADQTIFVSEGEPPLREGGFYLLRDPQLCIYEKTADYALIFPASKQIREASLSKDGSQVVFYCTPPYGETLIYDLFHAIRLAFLYLAEGHSMYAIHSASILYRDRAWLFSGSSGTGKSTHTNLWKEYVSTPVINGDLNLLAFQNGKPVIHGMPWCGTSGICDAATYELGGIVLLAQESVNRILPMEENALRLGTFQRLISPLWDEKMLKNATDFVNRLAPAILLRKLGCTISPEAVTTIKAVIDQSIR